MLQPDFFSILEADVHFNSVVIFLTFGGGFMIVCIGFFPTIGKTMIFIRFLKVSINFFMTSFGFIRISESFAVFKFRCELSIYSIAAFA